MLKLSKLEKFILKSKNIHGDKYDYTNTVYINSYTKVNIFCKTCNKEFYQLPSNHAYGKGCYDCSNNKRRSDEEFIKLYYEKHGDKYLYDKFKYISAFKKVEIFCKKCNIYFLQTPGEEHLQYGCNECAKEYRANLRKNKDDSCIFVGKREGYILKHKTVNLYLVEFKSSEELFYKIGITSGEVKNRFRCKNFKKYEIKIIDTFNFDTKTIIEMEDEILVKFKDYRYNPLHYFSGHTECFKESEVLIEYINLKKKHYGELYDTDKSFDRSCKKL